MLSAGAVHATVLLHAEVVTGGLHQEEFEDDCAATLQLKLPLLHHSPRACRVVLQSGDIRECHREEEEEEEGFHKFHEVVKRNDIQMTEHVKYLRDAHYRKLKPCQRQLTI